MVGGTCGLRRVMPSCGKSVWIVSWAADCLFERKKVELHRLYCCSSPTFSPSFLLASRRLCSSSVLP